MKKFILSLFLFFAKISFSVAPGDYFFTSTGIIAFTSSAPLEIITASSDKMRGLIDEAKKTFSFRVQYRTFEGFRSGLQREHFNENYMESEKYPEAFFNGTIEDEIDFSKDGTYTVNAKGKLNIHGVERDRTIKSTLTITDGIAHVETQFQVLLVDHNIKIPKIVTQKIATEITVDVKGDLKKRFMQH
ncbi:MAG: YceI family protein [Bacteroidia bacterium]